MRIHHAANLSRFSAGGCRQVFATCPRSISIFSPPCKKIPARNITLSNERRDSVFREGDFGINDEIRAKNAEALSLPSDGNWQVFRSKKTMKKMGNHRDTSLNIDRLKHTASKQSLATGANLVPLEKVRIFEPKPNIRQRRICNIPAYLMEPQFSLYSKCGVFVKWTGSGEDTKRIVDWWLAISGTGEQFGSFLGCEGLVRMVLNKNTKILVEFDSNSWVLEPTKLVTNRGEWNIHPTFYDGVINETDIWLKSSPVLVNSIDQKENPLSDQNEKITLNSIHENANCPPVTNTDVNKQNNISNINDLDKIIDEANSIKEEALVEMSKRISDSVDSLKSPSETKSVENLGQDNEADQEEMSSRMAAVLEVFNNNVVENLSPEEEDEKRFLIQELLASMDEEENNENRVGDITPLPVNDYTAAQSQLGEDDGEGVIVPQQTLGITNIYDGKNFPDCAREAKSRGRKSLSELRLQDGNAKDQGKLTSFFDAGKGKGLPTVQ
ncbi:hypothetical protein SUGI_0526790 [Cryptomeria japonica]|nr:hypothetical protein SUGI_0526790 [Cryptomeria japonica]